MNRMQALCLPMVLSATLVLAACITTDGSITGLGDFIRIKTVSGRDAANGGIVSDTLATHPYTRDIPISPQEEAIAQQVLSSPQYLDTGGLFTRVGDDNRCITNTYDERGFHADCKTVWHNATLGEMRMWCMAPDEIEPNGRLCRTYTIEYFTTGGIGLYWRKHRGRACQKGDGLWRKV